MSGKNRIQQSLLRFDKRLAALEEKTAVTTQLGTTKYYKDHLTRGVQELFKAAESLPAAIVELLAASLVEIEATVPEGLARALMLTGSKMEVAVECSAGQYVEALQDCAKIEQIAETVPDECDREQLRKHTRREVQRHFKNLQALGVTVQSVEPDSPFDPNRHDPVDFEDTTDLQQDETVSECRRPSFVWRDEHNQEQVLLAEVTIRRYQQAKNEESNFTDSVAQTSSGNGSVVKKN